MKAAITFKKIFNFNQHTKEQRILILKYLESVKNHQMIIKSA